MSKRLPANETSRPPVRLRLPQISSQELKTIRVAIRRKDVPQDAVHTGPLIRSLDDPEGLILHKPGEGEKPIFDREDIIVNLDFEERIVVATDNLRSSRSEERQKSNSRSRRSRSRSRQKSVNRDYYSRSRSRSNDRIPRSSGSCVKEDSRKSNTSFRRTLGEHSNRTDKSGAYDSETETSSGVKNRRRSSSKERQRSSSRDREHSKFYRRKSPRPESYRSRHYESERRRRTPSPGKYDYRHRKYSRSPTYKREASYRSHAHYSKSQERRSRSPYRDRDSKYKDYRKRSRSPPYSRERYKSPGRKEHREYSRSPPKYRGPPDDQRRPMPPYQIPPSFGPPWPVYEPVPPYLRFVVPEGYMPAPPPRIPGNMLVRPRMPPRQLPIYNNRPIPKVKDSDTNAPTSTISIPSTSSAPSTSVTATTTANVTEEIAAKSESVQSTDAKDSKDKGDSATTDKSVD